ncbi:hypothetical protein IF650_04135 [Cellulosimicrobium terreum]|nr:hypothetical protein [Cellulosimicrobium terreum]
MIRSHTASRASRASASTVGALLLVASLAACATETDEGGTSSESPSSAPSEPSAEPTPSEDGAAMPEAASMTIEAGARGKGLPVGVDGPTVGGTGAAWSAEPGLLYVVTSGSSTCPLVAEPDAQVRDGEVVVTFVDLPDGPCTMDLVPATSVVAVPDDADPSGEVTVVLGDKGTVVVPPAQDGATGEAVWVEEESLS